MIAFRLVRGALSSTPPVSPRTTYRSACADVDNHQLAVMCAHRAVIDSAPGKMLPALDAWREAERKLEAATKRERRARLVMQGVRWLCVAKERS